MGTRMQGTYVGAMIHAQVERTEIEEKRSCRSAHVVGRNGVAEDQCCCQEVNLIAQGGLMYTYICFVRGARPGLPRPFATYRRAGIGVPVEKVQ